MTRLTRLLMSGAALGIIACASTESVPADQRVDAQEAFARMKTLAGKWKATMPSAPGQSVPVSFEVASGGHSLLEKLFDGQPHEMVTMYYLEGENLELEHYCSIGNRPHLRLDRTHSTRDDLHFDYVSGNGIDTRKDEHIHALRVTFKDPETIVATWTGWKDGAQEPPTEFVLSRKGDAYTPPQ